MISAAQLRAARGLLDWTRNELAEAAKISPETVKNIEHGVFRPQEQTADAIIRAFALHDVEFTANEGVRKAANNIITYDGHEGFKSFMDSLYEEAQKPHSINGSKPICVSNVDNNLFKKALKGYADTHVERMSKINGLKIHILATKKEENINSGSSYMDYKYMKNDSSLPFYVFGNKLAIINFDVEDPPKIIVINSDAVAQSYRNQFNIMWNGAASAPFSD